MESFSTIVGVIVGIVTGVSTAVVIVARELRKNGWKVDIKEGGVATEILSVLRAMDGRLLRIETFMQKIQERGLKLL